MLSPLTIGTHTLSSRLIVGTGKYATYEQMGEALERSGADCVTVAVRRERLIDAEGKNLLDYVDPQRYTILPNTAGCFDVESAVRTAELARELLGTKLVKLEVLGDQKTLLPDPVGTLEATEELVAQGFDVLVYCSDDPIQAKRLEDMGCCAIMPLGAPIGSGLGLNNEYGLRTLRAHFPDIPLVIDAGLGVPSHAAKAMEMGFDAVLLNTAVAKAGDPVAMAAAFALAIEAGRLAAEADPMEPRDMAAPSTPVIGKAFL